MKRKKRKAKLKCQGRPKPPVLFMYLKGSWAGKLTEPIEYYGYFDAKRYAAQLEGKEDQCSKN